ncbi:M20/M25/M40 family metallo-hydrolase [Soonwooa sp.]|uniref:M20/M25/M40 family metallo-hydrolase n=1 Tax=Soonwooa sp. TaxID=1938592 RepID=UPI002609CF57|nr:M20/M25/M40 family metallo-hydrolase [Soonwooa sp.]
MKIHLPVLAAVFFSGVVFAQQENTFHATMDGKSAQALQDLFPKEVSILKTVDNQSAVILTENAAHHLHKNILTHGPGYVYHDNVETALEVLTKKASKSNLLNLTISENDWVNYCIGKVNTDNIKTHIQTLEAYGTRRHDNAKGKQAALDLKAKWEAMIAAAGRTDISVTLFNHTLTPMPSVILKINGNSAPNESVIIGGHLDSISNTSQAPGADDNASGIASITEILRVLLDTKFKPQKNIEIMAYSAEEVGLVGSKEIATQYANANKNVVAYVQFDMTNYKGSSKDVYLTTDSYNSNDLNLFLIELMEHYNKTSAHAFTYGNTICNYGCSDHFSWAQNGYNAAFPFEASFSDSNPYIHSANDTFSVSGNSATHAAKFTKLGLEFLIETAKSSQAFMAVQDVKNNDLKVVVQSKVLNLSNVDLGKIKSVKILDASGRIVKESLKPNSSKISLENLKESYYLCIVENNDGTISSTKFINQ